MAASLAGCAGRGAAPEPKVVQLAPDGTFASRIVTAPLSGGQDGDVVGLHVRMQRTIDGTLDVGAGILVDSDRYVDVAWDAVSVQAVEAGGRYVDLGHAGLSPLIAGRDWPTRGSLAADVSTGTVVIRVVASLPKAVGGAGVLVCERRLEDVPIVANLWPPWGNPPPPEPPCGPME